MAQAAKAARASAQMETTGERRRFSIERLAIATIVLGYILILIGGVVRIEGAGMGCGDDWPVCNGKVVPTFSYLTTIEYVHRVVAGMILLLTSWLALAAWRRAHGSDARRWLAVSALVLVLAQAGLGAITVFAELDPRAVTAHLGMAQAYFALVILIALAGRYGIRRPTTWPPSRVMTAAAVAGAITFGLLLTGAYTASGGAAWACPEWPLCGDKYVPTGWSPADIHMLHRWLALLTVASISWLLIAAWRASGQSSKTTRLAALALALTLTEVTIGAANIWFELADWVRISHLAFATLVWGALVATVALAVEPGPVRTASGGQAAPARA